MITVVAMLASMPPLVFAIFDLALLFQRHQTVDDALFAPVRVARAIVLVASSLASAWLYVAATGRA